MDRYECDMCGACCKGNPIVEADDLDVVREPRIIDADPDHQGTPVEQMVDAIRNDWKAVVLACGRPCAFLAEDNRCGIYPTRPNACIAFDAGDEQCQEVRAAHGLAPLEPVVASGSENTSES